MSPPHKGRIYEFGPYRLDTDAALLQCPSEGRTIRLTPRVYDTLLFLLEHAGQLVEKRRLMQAIWPNVVVEENNLDQHISALRQALGERRGENTYIVTVRGRGYRFAAPVIESGAATQPAEAKRIRTFNLVPIVTVLMIPFAAAAVLLLGEREPTPTLEAATPTLAVLPFRPLTATDRNESLELGMAETLIAGLNTAELTVSPLSAVRRFTDVEQDAVSAGRALGVHSVLEGHIQRDGDRLRVATRLLDVASGRQLWQASHDEPFTDIFSVQNLIATRVRAALLPELTSSPPELRRHTNDAEAYQLYVNGRFHRQSAREAGLRQAVSYFEQATARDPLFASAWVGLADTYSVLGVFGIMAPHDAFPRARRAVDRALALAPHLGEAHASLGHIKAQYEHDWSGAEQALRHAVALDSNYAPAQQWLGLYFAYTGRFEEGLVHMRNAQALEPSAPMYSALVGMVLHYSRRYDEASAQLQKTLEMDADLPTAHTYLAVTYLRKGEFDAAIRHLDRVTAPTPGGMSYVGQIHALSGRRAEALTEIRRLEALAQQGHATAYDIAAIYSTLGDADQAVAWLDRAFSDRSQLISWLPWDAAFDGLRLDPRYRELANRLDPGH